MIIILGPDHSGKTTLAKSFVSSYYHFTKDSEYEDYLKPLASLQLYNGVADRFIFCERPYSSIKGRLFKFSLKQWDNIILLALAQKPLIILCDSKPTAEEYKDTYLPYNKWDICLAGYKSLLDGNSIPYVTYDYHKRLNTDVFTTIESRYREEARWWVPMWRKGIGMIGSQNPVILLVAERLGPKNVNLLPFETGPTGYMLTEMLHKTNTPLGEFAVTNIVKAPRGDTRDVSPEDLDYFDLELTHLKPRKVVFMGKVAEKGISVAKSHGVPFQTITHLGFFKHRGVTDMAQYYSFWRAIREGGVKLFEKVPRT